MNQPHCTIALNRSNIYNWRLLFDKEVVFKRTVFGNKKIFLGTWMALMFHPLFHESDLEPFLHGLVKHIESGHVKFANSVNRILASKSSLRRHLSIIFEVWGPFDYLNWLGQPFQLEAFEYRVNTSLPLFLGRV